MKINTELAQKIVESLRDTIEQDINFIDSDGIIIASTDHRRINSLHEGALTLSLIHISEPTRRPG